ncbi:YraN family protein [Maridesulfovibrio ferrireducens]|uniref:UPF0102 protein SAMN05660337_0334 n=1 Tax=Maridesulfovibrio ferrireducens TaxID=246191 RepID=A0A1G9BL02_9BACT|nr:YraN family protein [Maridesulfovibrio ferrireducens]MBI9112053.1 YraN family protein [Maridesulfovibrio ferrireducens]SDK40137.1 putative endonuclease [Maridesulfovibrio ferrireducens]
MSPRHLDFGEAGEKFAARYLECRGFSLRHRNWRWHQWELDIVCDGPADSDGVRDLVFVEVKTRAGNSVQKGLQAVTPAKCRKLVKAASHYLSAMDLWHRPCRFDLVIVNDAGNGMNAEHIKNAFEISDFMGSGNTAWQPW